MTTAGKTVVVGLSGGVDSSVAAALLLEQGYTVIGVFIKAWQPEFLSCTWKDDRQSAMQVAAALNIPFHTADLSQEYKQYVFDEMLASYARGETPNPDVACNEFIKFGFFLQFAATLGADYVATGHYAQITHTGTTISLVTARDAEKDQSYFLSHVEPDVLSKILFPIGHLLKSEVRRIAKSRKLPTHNRKDSQGLCFVGHLDMKDFLKQTVPHKPGNVLNESGKVVGQHDGAELYTVGERHGFVMHDTSRDRSPQYVVHKDIDANTLTVSTARVHVRRLEIKLRAVRWYMPQPDTETKLSMRYRYRQDVLPCFIVTSATGVSVTVESSMDIPSPGQLLVLYAGNRVVGSGFIDSAVESARE